MNKLLKVAIFILLVIITSLLYFIFFTNRYQYIVSVTDNTSIYTRIDKLTNTSCMWNIAQAKCVVTFDDAYRETKEKGNTSK